MGLAGVLLEYQRQVCIGWEEVATIRLEVAPPRRQLARCRNTEHRQLDRIHLLDLPIVNATKEIPIRS